MYGGSGVLVGKPEGKGITWNTDTKKRIILKRILKDQAAKA